MLSGTEFFDSVDDRLSRAEREARAAEREVEALSARRDEVRAAEAGALRTLARLRLVAIRDGGAALGRLDAAEERVRALLTQRGEALRDAEAALVRHRDAVAAAQAERDRRRAALRAMEETQAEALRAAREKASSDPEWRRLHTAAEEAGRVAAHATQKAALAHKDLEAKGDPYRDDPLFAYLWGRGYGTARYRAGPLGRLLDGWTAKVADYEPARRSYALLNELPARLDAHAERMRERASAAAEALAAHERGIAGVSGAELGLGAAQEALEMAEQALDSARAAAAQAEAARAALASGGDEATRQAEAQLEAALGAEGLRALRETARRTPTPDDDVIVARLESAAVERERVERELSAARASADAARTRLSEVQLLRQEMRRRGYGRDRWDFKDGALVGVLIGELLRGGLSRDGFWDRMGRHRMPEGGPWGGGPWGGGPWGGGVRQPGRWNPPDDDGFQGGGFGTGGGFGGDRGGFSTGGRIEGGGGFKTGGSF